LRKSHFAWWQQTLLLSPRLVKAHLHVRFRGTILRSFCKNNSTKNASKRSWINPNKSAAKSDSEIGCVNSA
jgi:hypothetical protein